jgi:small subunit ribosomal protein S17
MERNSRRVLAGTVVSASSDKTISVLVVSYKKHKLYGKRMKQTKKFAAHDELNIAEVGDSVRIVETRPLSKTKRFRLLEVVEKKS